VTRKGRSSSFSISLTVTAPLANSTIVISQVYGGGGNAGALFSNDYIQLYNRGSATSTYPDGRSSMRPRQARATGPASSRSAAQSSRASTTSSGWLRAAPSAPRCPPANVNGQINMAQGAGKVALVDNGDTLTGAGCPVSTHIKDLVGYGSTANCWEGTATAAVSGNLTATALFRLGAGVIDTNDNKADFVQSGPPNPFRTAPIVQLPPSVFTTDPTTNDTNVPRDATIEVSFTGAVAVDPGWFDINCATTGAHNSATEAPDGNNRWITPTRTSSPVKCARSRCSRRRFTTPQPALFRRLRTTCGRSRSRRARRRPNRRQFICSWATRPTRRPTSISPPIT
jgi:hypothetical protein